MNDNLLILFGLLLGIVLALVGVQTDWFSSMSTEMWSFGGSLIGASITVMGAYWLWTRQAANERERKQRAALLPLADTLTEICRYASSGMMHWIAIEEHESSFDEALSRETVEVLQGVAEWFDGNISRAAARVGQKYQLCRARGCRDFENQDEHFRIGVVLTFAELNALAVRLFSFARADSDDVEMGPITQTEICSVFGGSSGNDLWAWYQRTEVMEIVRQEYAE